MSRADRLVRITGIILVALGVLFLGLNIWLGGSINITLPFVFFMLGGAFFLLVFLYTQRWRWAVWLFIPGSLLIAFGFIFLLNILTDEWSAWAYAWLLLVASAGFGAILASKYQSLDQRVGLVGSGAVVVGLTLFALFGVIAGGLFIRYMAPILLGLGGLALFWLKPASILPEAVLKRIEPALGESQAEVLLPASPNQSALVEPLSNRELEVLRLIETGLSNSEIAEKLVVAPSTVKTHINNIYSKLNVQTRVQALKRARELGLIDS